MSDARSPPPFDLAALCATLANLNGLRMTSTTPAPASEVLSKNTPAPCWHALPVQQVLARLACDPATGLSAAEADRRRAQDGANTLPEPPRRSTLAIVVRQFKSPLIYILFVASVLAIALSHHGDAVVILLVVLANALIGAFQEGRAERSMTSLRKLSALHVRALRGGHETLIEARDLVAGDVLLLAAGDAVGADARLIESAQLQVAEAALTGESVPVSKAAAALCEDTGLADRHNMVFSGTYATAGRGRAVVVAIGAQTEVGRIAGMTENATEPKTPLEQRIDQFGRWLVAAALGLFIAVVALGLYRELPLADVLMVAISQMVSMVPEGLPVAMTIALAVGMQRMAGRGAIIRRLSAVETLGSTTVICTDKTGTLTRNEMTVSRLWLPDGLEVSVSGVGYAPEGELSAEDAATLPLLQAAALCNDAQLLPPHASHAGWTVLGDPTEGALIVLAVKAGMDLEKLARDAPREAELPFDSDTKMMATRHRCADAPHRVFIKGAPEAVLGLCSAADRALTQAAHAAAEAMAGRALRVLAFAVVDDDRLDAGFGALTGRARLLGLVGQIDPPREEVKAAVTECRTAGIRPVMVTGDHKLTGLAIARELGIARDGDRAVDGGELERMSEADLRSDLSCIAVFARVHPAQKLRIVEALQARGEVVAMTGDGVNDAPALARADVGVAMGITGTEVAKSAAKIIITDDNFSTIVGAVEQGRVVYGNLKKVILYLFATSIDEVALLLLALLGGYPLPLAAVQILWINIVTEGTLTVNLVMDPPNGDEMKRVPVPRNDRLIDRTMLGRVLLMSTAAVLVTFGWFVYRLHQEVPIELVRTETFTLLAMCQWFNVLNCQSASRSALALGLLKNPWLLGGLSLSMGLQALVLYAPPLNTLFYTVPLAPASLLPLAALASCVLWAEELRKLITGQLSIQHS
ncbi:ATPase, P-type (transporting), HAD superfamily, subfamily IC [Polaromonas sp. CG9_12]|nr:ATPase, P-type (transporting), HAD superfamily, subfamily IC [Polaromonas sp. CG9_12]